MVWMGVGENTCCGDTWYRGYRAGVQGGMPGVKGGSECNYDGNYTEGWRDETAGMGLGGLMAQVGEAWEGEGFFGACCGE